MRRWLHESTCALVAGLAFLPGLAGAATVAVYLAEWPSDDDGALLFAVGTAIGAVTWFLGSLLFARGLTRPETANSAVYGELRVRATSLVAAVEALTPQAQASPEVRRKKKKKKKKKNAISPPTIAQRHAHEVARRQCERLIDELNLTSVPLRRSEDPSLSWLLAYGYVNLWRRVHRAEEALLELEAPQNLYVAAILDETRLRNSSIEGHDLLADQLKKLVAESAEAVQPSAGVLAWTPGLAKPLAFLAGGKVADLLMRLGQPQARALIRECRHALNRYRNDLWDGLVHLRNLLFVTMVFTGIVTYAVLGLAVVTEVDRSALIAASTFYLVGAVVGLFGELYTTSRRESGAVNDYGLGLVRVVTVPLLSGIAAVGGVVLTRLGGTSSDGIPALADIFSLEEYPAGIVVAAIFGLAPGLLLEQLRAQTETYKKEIEKTQAGGAQAGGSAAAS